MMVCSPPQPTWDITIYPPSGPSVLAGTLSFLQSMWDRPQIHPSLGPASLLAHRLVSTPFWGTVGRLTHRLALIPFVTTQIHRQQILSSLGFPFRASPQGFKTRLLGEGFHTLINGGVFSSPTNIGHHGYRFVVSIFSLDSVCGLNESVHTVWYIFSKNGRFGDVQYLN